MIGSTIGPTALAAVLILPACDDGSSKDAAPTPRRRVDAVPAKAKPKVDLQGFCDHRFEGAEAKPFALPELAEGKAQGGQGWRWVNVWATWCKPCIEELPLIDGWRDRFRKDGVSLELVFVSVDESADDIEAFRQKHPKTPEGARIADHEALGPWLQSLGLGESTALPIHLFVDPQDKLRCIRLGQVNERDYDNVAGLVSQN